MGDHGRADLVVNLTAATPEARRRLKHPMICPTCGTSSPSTTRYCPGCGADLLTAQATSTGTSTYSSPSAALAASRIHPQLQPGTLLNGRFRIMQVIGTGSFGRVYLAEDEQDPSNPPLAVKELLTMEFTNADEQRDAISWFKREVSILLSLEHPGIPAIHGYWTAHRTAGPMYLAMDYIPGKTLAALQAEAGGSLPWQQVVAWGISLCGVLAYLHSRMPPFIFRDLKPSNVLLDTRTDSPVLIDFGLARQLVPVDGTAIGTWGYVPYEQVLGKAEPRSDLYSLGSMLHGLVTGRQPDVEYRRLLRSGLDLESALRALFPAAHTIVPQVPALFSQILLRATAFNAEDRYPDATAMAAALERTVSSAPALVMPGPTAPAPPAEPLLSRPAQPSPPMPAQQPPGHPAMPEQRSLTTSLMHDASPSGPRGPQVASPRPEPAQSASGPLAAPSPHPAPTPHQAPIQEPVEPLSGMPERAIALDAPPAGTPAVPEPRPSPQPHVPPSGGIAGPTPPPVPPEQADAAAAQPALPVAGGTAESLRTQLLQPPSPPTGITQPLQPIDTPVPAAAPPGLPTQPPPALPPTTPLPASQRGGWGGLLRRSAPSVAPVAAPQALTVGEGGRFRTITEALQRAQAGARIEVAPGMYHEGLVLDKTVEIVGLGPPESVVVEAERSSCLLMHTDQAVVRGLLLRGRSPQGAQHFYAVNIPRGQLVMEDCHIRAEALACLAIHGNHAQPMIRRCSIRNSGDRGLAVYDSAGGTLEDCDIFGNTIGVRVSSHADPVLRNCRIHNGKLGGVIVEQGRGLFSDCQIVDNGHHGLAIRQNGFPVVRRCQINHNTWCAISVADTGGASVEECDLTGNARGAWEIRESARTRVKRRNNRDV